MAHSPRLATTMAQGMSSEPSSCAVACPPLSSPDTRQAGEKPSRLPAHVREEAAAATAVMLLG